MPTADSEAKRIEAVYARYDADPQVVAKWDPRNRGNILVRDEFHAALAALLAHEKVQPDGAKILDVGCGSGANLGWLIEIGARPQYLYGVDLLEDRIDLARKRYSGINLACGDARHLPFPDRFFDVILCINLFGSILDRTVASGVAAEIRRLVKPTGMIVWCDSRYRNFWNSNVRGYAGGEIRRLFPGCQVKLQSITVFPPLVRRLGPFAPVLYRLLGCIPPLRVRYLGSIRPSAEDDR